MKKVLLSAVAVLLPVSMLTECSNGGKAPGASVAKASANNIVYSRDSRSGLCFGSVISYTYGGNSTVSITNVPCEKVDSLLVK